MDPLLELRPFAVRHAVSRLGLSGEVARQAAATIQGLHQAFKTAEADLVEVNPLVATRDGRVIAAEAKVALDEEAAFRYPGWPREPNGGLSTPEIRPEELACQARTPGSIAPPLGRIPAEVNKGPLGLSCRPDEVRRGEARG